MSGKKVIFVVILVALFVIWQSIGDLFFSYPITNFPPKNALVLAWGDSITVGVGASQPEQGYVEVLKKRLSANIINKGVSGETTKDALLHAKKDIDEMSPGIVIIFLGGNDFLQGVDQKDTFTNLRELIDIAHSKKAVVYLIGFQKHAGDGYGVGFEHLAKESGLFYTPDILGGIIGDSTLMSDEIHPNNKGYLKIADKIAPTLEGILMSAGTEANSTRN